MTQQKAPKVLLHSDIPHVGEDVDVKLPDHMEEDTEHIPCTVCKQAEVQPHNDMMGCDGCDRWFHQKCLQPNLLAIPEGDWYCTRDAHSHHPLDKTEREGWDSSTPTKTTNTKNTRTWGCFQTPLTALSSHMKGNNKTQGERSHKERGIYIADEIQLKNRNGPTHTTVPAPDPPTKRIQALLQNKLENGSLTITIQETDPYNDINPTGEYTLRDNGRKGTVKA
jgi:hypothetical protein